MLPDFLIDQNNTKNTAVTVGEFAQRHANNRVLFNFAWKYSSIENWSGYRNLSVDLQIKS